MTEINEIQPGVLWWSARHPRIGFDVFSHWIVDAGAVLDPMAPDDVLDRLAERPPKRVLLTNRHHYRQADRLVERFGCEVLCPESGLHEFGPDTVVTGYAWGEEVAPGIVAHEIGAICPDDGALHINVAGGLLALADSVIGWDGGLAFVPDFLIGDDPEGVKRRTLDALERLLELPFEDLLLAHAPPIAGDGRDALAEFIASPRQADFST